jgi:hypothetical protein
MLNEVKHLAIEREILRCAQNDTLCFEIFSKDVIYQKCQENATFVAATTNFCRTFQDFF